MTLFKCRQENTHTLEEHEKHTFERYSSKWERYFSNYFFNLSLPKNTHFIFRIDYCPQFQIILFLNNFPFFIFFYYHIMTKQSDPVNISLPLFVNCLNVFLQYFMQPRFIQLYVQICWHSFCLLYIWSSGSEHFLPYFSSVIFSFIVSLIIFIFLFLLSLLFWISHDYGFNYPMVSFNFSECSSTSFSAYLSFSSMFAHQKTFKKCF